MGTHSLLGKRPDHRPPRDQCEGGNHHHCAGLQGGNQVSPLSGASGLLYEWQKLDAKTKQPFAIAMKDGKPHVLATDPNEVVEQLHDRMPCIIREKDYDRWLKSGDPDRPPLDLLRPFDADKMTAWKVDKAVGNVKNDRPELIEPTSNTTEQVEEPLGERPGSLFP